MLVVADSPTPPLPICHLWYEDDLTPTATTAEKIGEEIEGEGEGWRTGKDVRQLIRGKKVRMWFTIRVASVALRLWGFEDVSLTTRKKK